ncbi:hypothetical protein M501DRAFT_1031812 [Patellaria atrata CBS 101060]|uniref:Uncharacterized protein n=1 Tax=Patellaria atrata CBS 101060 TaxID=1346257 RepID=A0A9P4VPF2_9PEZI|nr:hypothetical protein M501DRAFT_1031812 [Patellaria atrata CBS 101060]
MTSQDASSLKSPTYSDPDSSIILPKRKQDLISSTINLGRRGSSPSLDTLYASTTLPRPASDSSTSTLTASSIFPPGSIRRTASPGPPASTSPDDPRNLVQRALVPTIYVLPSSDTEELMQEKGIQGGLAELLRPFGDNIHGKVTIRDSIGASKSFDDYGVRFIGLRDSLNILKSPPRRSTERRPSTVNGIVEPPQKVLSPLSRLGGDISHVEEVVDRHLSYAESQSQTFSEDYLNSKQTDPEPSSSASPYFTHYVKRLLSGIPLTPHETFSHPVACVISISSRNPNALEELRRLYTATNSEFRLPPWVSNDFLRYYLLVHDEDHDDVAQSQTLYEQMKRHFGLHCHLLRIKSTRCLPTDDDSIKLPLCGWISAGEELMEIQKRVDLNIENSEDDEDPTPCLIDSDMTAIRTFVRELVVQSVVPTMERLSAQWNEQVASRRRGISGRFMSLSKRWTPFGSSSRNSSSPVGGQSSTGNNYDSLHGFYRPDTPEAIMRRLGDFAFMLRDFKLAQSTYDVLRTDFNNDKAWKHYAGANEMTALSSLLLPPSASSKGKVENVDQQLETANYSYATRCSDSYSALRALTLGAELLRIRGSSNADQAAKWNTRIIENRLVGPIGFPIYTERVSSCYSSRPGVGSMGWGSRRRKAAFWNVMATDQWLRLGKSLQAERCLNEATAQYNSLEATDSGVKAFDAIQAFLEDIREVVTASRRAAVGYDEAEEDVEEEEEEEVVEEVGDNMNIRRRGKSLLGGGQAPFGGMDNNALSPMRTNDDEPAFKDENFKDENFE